MSARTDILAALQRAGYKQREAVSLLESAYKEPHADEPDPDFRETLAGGHALVIEYGDCEIHASCQCGKRLGMTSPDASLDTFVRPWERHCMTEVAH
ncbi:hypothetical protein [Streptomyces sp. NPDC001221]